MSNKFDWQDNIPTQSEETRAEHRSAPGRADSPGHGPDGADSGCDRSYHFFGSGPTPPPTSAATASTRSGC